MLSLHLKNPQQHQNNNKPPSDYLCLVPVLQNGLSLTVHLNFHNFLLAVHLLIVESYNGS